MKRLQKLLLFSLAIIVVNVVAVWTPASKVQAAAPNLISNPSVEQMSPANPSLPLDWSKNKWGTNNAVFTYLGSGGHSSSRSVKVVITNYTSGDAKWYFEPVAVQPSTTYTFSDYYKSSTRTELLAMFISTEGQVSYQWLTGVSKTTTWKKQTATITTPANIDSMTVLHVLTGVGNLQTDQFSLKEQEVPTITIASPAAGATVSDNVVVSAQVSGNVAGIQFKVDGTNVGAEVTAAPYQVNWDTTSLSNTQHIITAIARPLAGPNVTSSPITVTVANLAQPGSNIIYNPLLEVQNPNNANLPDGWQTNRSQNNQGSFEYLNTGHTGSRSVKITTTSHTSGDAYWSHAPQPVVGGKTYEFTDYYKSDVNTEVYAHIYMQDGSEQWEWVGAAEHSNGWNHFDQQFVMPVGAVSADVYHALYQVGYLITDDYNLHEYAPQGFTRGLVSLTFDDAIKSTYTNGLPILQEFSYVSTQYALTGFTDDPYYMTVPMIQAFKDAGHEVASHTVTHPELTMLTPEELQTELTQSKSDLTTWLGAAPPNFATPHGAYNAEVLDAIEPLYRSHRSVDTGFNSKDNFDIYNIKVYNVVSITPLSEIERVVNQAMAENTWLVIVYHGIDSVENDSSFWNITPDQLRSHLTAIQTAGLQVVTVQQALDEIEPQL